MVDLDTYGVAFSWGIVANVNFYFFKNYLTNYSKIDFMNNFSFFFFNLVFSLFIIFFTIESIFTCCGKFDHCLGIIDYNLPPFFPSSHQYNCPQFPIKSNEIKILFQTTYSSFVSLFNF